MVSVRREAGGSWSPRLHQFKRFGLANMRGVVMKLLPEHIEQLAQIDALLVKAKLGAFAKHIRGLVRPAIGLKTRPPKPRPSRRRDTVWWRARPAKGIHLARGGRRADLVRCAGSPSADRAIRCRGAASISRRAVAVRGCVLRSRVGALLLRCRGIEAEAGPQRCSELSGGGRRCATRAPPPAPFVYVGRARRSGAMAWFGGAHEQRRCPPEGGIRALLE